MRSRKPPANFWKARRKTSNRARANSLDVMFAYYFTDDWDDSSLAPSAPGTGTPRPDARGSRIAHDSNAAHHAFSRQRARHSWRRRARGLPPGERVLLAAGNLGELERYVDLCHEYEVPYRLGEIEESATSARLAEDSTAGSVPAIVLCRAPFTDGVVFLDARVTIYGTGDLFETMPAGAASKRRPKTASFFSDFSELKPGDYVVHVDHGIGQFEGLAPDRKWRRARRVHAPALCGRCAPVRAARTPGPGAELSRRRGREARSRQAGRQHLDGAKGARTQVGRGHGRQTC